MDAIRVLCVEDNRLVAEALERKLHPDDGFEYIGWVSNAADLYDTVAKERPHIVCMDLDLPGQDSFEMVRTLAEKHPDTRTVVLTGHMSREYVNKALDAGAWGYLSKAEQSAVIIGAIRKVAAGEFAMGPITTAEYVRVGGSPHGPSRAA